MKDKIAKRKSLSKKHPAQRRRYKVGTKKTTLKGDRRTKQ